MHSIFRPWGLLGLAALVVVWLVRPFFHSLAMSLYVNPLGVVLLALLVLLPILMVVRMVGKTKVKMEGGKLAISANGANLGVLVVLIPLVIIAFTLYAAESGDLQKLQAYRSLTYNTLSTLPSMRQQREVPLQVAERYGLDALQTPTEMPGEWHPQFWPGDNGRRLSFVAARQPDGFIRYFTRKPAGLEIVRADTSGREVVFANQEMKYSEGVGITDNIRWQIYQRRFFIDIPEVFYGKDGNDLVAVAPVVAYKGWLVRYPVFDGAYFVYPDGRIDYRNAAEAQKHPAVASAGRLIPEELVRFQHEAYAMKGGLINKLFVHDDQIEISDPLGELNAQPYLLDTGGSGLTWFTAADPWGTSYGVFKVLTTDAITGKISVYSIPAQSAMTGAQQSIGYIQSSNPQFNWSVEGSDQAGGSGNIIAVEPRPQVIKGELYWMVSVTTTESKGINATCFLEAKTNKVQCFKEDKDITAFVSGQSVVETTATPATSEDTTTRINRLEELLNQAATELQRLKSGLK